MQVSWFDDLHLADLSESKKSALLTLLSEFSGMFPSITGPSGCTTAVKQAILTTEPPIHQPMHQLPEALKVTDHTEVQQMLDNNIIRLSPSPWS